MAPIAGLIRSDIEHGLRMKARVDIILETPFIYLPDLNIIITFIPTLDNEEILLSILYGSKHLEKRTWMPSPVIDRRSIDPESIIGKILDIADTYLDELLGTVPTMVNIAAYDEEMFNRATEKREPAELIFGITRLGTPSIVLVDLATRGEALRADRVLRDGDYMTDLSWVRTGKIAYTVKGSIDLPAIGREERQLLKKICNMELEPLRQLERTVVFTDHESSLYRRYLDDETISIVELRNIEQCRAIVKRRAVYFETSDGARAPAAAICREPSELLQDIENLCVNEINILMLFGEDLYYR